MITPESKENNYFTKTSDGQYDRHKYKINCKDGSSVITYDYNDVIENYWHKHQLIENVEVIDIKPKRSGGKGF